MEILEFQVKFWDNTAKVTRNFRSLVYFPCPSAIVDRRSFFLLGLACRADAREEKAACVPAPHPRYLVPLTPGPALSGAHLSSTAPATASRPRHHLHTLTIGAHAPTLLPRWTFPLAARAEVEEES